MSVYETVVKKNSELFTVIFNGFANRAAIEGAQIRSDTISAAGNKWQVWLYPGGFSDDHYGCGRIRYYLVNMSSRPAEASVTMTVRDAKSREISRFDTDSVKYFAAWPGDTYVTRDKHMWGNCAIRSSDFQTDALIVDVAGCVTGETKHRVLLTGSPVPQRSAALLEFLTAGGLSDFSICAANGAEELRIPVHKVVLSLSSPVLKAMLESGMSESAVGELRFADCDVIAVKEFVHYLYSDTCNVVSHSEALLALAHRYEVPGLQRLCEHQLVVTLTTTNVLHVLSLADLYDSVELKAGVLRYITQHSAALLSTGTFLPNLTPKQCQEVVCAMSGIAYTTAVPTSHLECNPASTAVAEKK
jgi:hypothetical protein